MSNTLRFHLVENEGVASLTCFINGKVHTANNTHASWSQLVHAVKSADENTNLNRLVGLFDPAVGIQTFFNKVSERVSVAGDHVYLDGDEINDGLADAIIRFTSENDPARSQALIAFLENVQTNPNEHSRTQLYDWLSRRDFTITAEGNFLAYKGVRSRQFSTGYGGQPSNADLTTYPYESISTGTAIVDGQVFNGAIPNGVGAVVEMPRGDVQHDPSVGCHTGLHAGTWEYASNFSQGAVLLVEINPRDVVSVPTDCDWQKIRTCRYTVKRVVDAPYNDSFDEDFSDDAPFEGTEENSWIGDDTAF